MNNDKKVNRQRRAAKTRARIKSSLKNRLVVYRTPRHIYAQVIDTSGQKVLACASTVESKVKSELKGTGNSDAAVSIGKLIAERSIEKGIDSVAFDRSGFKYHGRVKALAEAAREAGLKF